MPFTVLVLAFLIVGGLVIGVKTIINKFFKDETK